MLIFLLVTVALVLLNSAKQKRIFILHSYNTDYAWTRGLNLGLEKGMRELSHGRVNYDVRYYYMNAKNIPFETDADARGPVKQALQAIEMYQPDVIIAFDDIAQKFVVAPNYINRSGVNIVFSGVNGDEARYCKLTRDGVKVCYNTAVNVVGTLERIPVASVIDIIHFLQLENPQTLASTKHVHFLLDESITAMQDALYLERQDWQDMEFSVSPPIDTYEDWQNYILGINQENVDFLLVDGYRKLRIGEGVSTNNSAEPRIYADPIVVARWTEANSNIPVIGLNAFSSEDGFMLSVGVSASALGYKAFAKASHLITDDPPVNSLVRVDISDQYVVAINQPAMKQRGLKIPNMLQVFARATEHFYE